MTKVKKMTLLLQRTMSSYYPAFKSMLDGLEAGMMEAQDISIYLKPVGCMLENLEELSYQELAKRFPALFHVVALVWAHCKHYRHPVRLVVLLQEISNMIIELVCYICLVHTYFRIIGIISEISLVHSCDVVTDNHLPGT